MNETKKSIKSKLLWAGAGVLVIAAGIIGCSAVKSVGDSMGGQLGGVISGAATAGQAATLNEKDEDAYGKSIAIAITNQYPVSTDQALLVYVNYIGQTLVSKSAKPDRDYIFGVLETKDVGAFSGPNGYIFVTRGAITSAKDEAELAGVIGHELTHVLDQDGLHAVQAAMVKEGLLHAGAAALNIDQAMGGLTAGTDLILKNGYDKQQEFAADKGSVHLLIAAGYDPNSFLNYLKRLDAEQSSGAGGGIMSTHPGLHDRVGKVAKEIASANVHGGVTLADRFSATVSPGAAPVQ